MLICRQNVRNQTKYQWQIKEVPTQINIRKINKNQQQQILFKPKIVSQICPTWLYQLNNKIDDRCHRTITKPPTDQPRMLQLSSCCFAQCFCKWHHLSIYLVLTSLTFPFIDTFCRLTYSWAYDGLYTDTFLNILSRPPRHNGSEIENGMWLSASVHTFQNMTFIIEELQTLNPQSLPWPC